MTILASVRGHLKILGILPLSKKDLPFALQEYKSVVNHAYNCFWHISLATYSLTVVCFILFEAKTFLEYTGSAFFLSVTFLHFVSHIILFTSKWELIDLFKESDEIVKKSTYSVCLLKLLEIFINKFFLNLEKGSVEPAVRLLYAQQDEETTKLSKTCLKSGFIFAEIFLFPYAAQSFFMYYTTDLGEDSFMPLFPSKYLTFFKT